ncbi:Cdc6/Cdc18 family protein [Halobium salinum]|uniref:ORC1-type DNA replication protein n=1 Tax=Halobium salinum TaxID=1364940 RepID=A0ABD5P6U2_9EURY|nr:orc1/cdc6 family replication initiation protein [Halobium salinum]
MHPPEGTGSLSPSLYTDGGQDIAREIFEQEDHIFADKDLLNVDHVPSAERIVGRDDEIRKLAEELRSAVDGHSPENVIIYGKTGTGKSLVAKHVSTSAQGLAKEGVSIGTAYIDCSTDNTETQAISTLAREFNEPERTDVDVPETGLATAVYYKRLWAVLDILYDVVIVVLDEADMMASDDLLMKLSRAGETGNTDAHIGVIAVSNKVEWADDLNERVKSSLQPKELAFQPYDATQLREIMENRRDAFEDGVLSEDVIPLCAAFAAQDFGDARKAIDILRHSGQLAYRQSDEQVVESHVREARTEAEKDRFKELIEGHPQQAKAILLALSLLSANSEKDEFQSQLVYRQYTNIAEKIDMDSLSDRRFRDILKEQAFLDIIDVWKENLGRSGGINLYCRLIENPEIVVEIISGDPRFEGLSLVNAATPSEN